VYVHSTLASTRLSPVIGYDMLEGYNPTRILTQPLYVSLNLRVLLLVHSRFSLTKLWIRMFDGRMDGMISSSALPIYAFFFSFSLVPDDIPSWLPFRVDEHPLYFTLRLCRASVETQISLCYQLKLFKRLGGRLRFLSP